MDREALDRLSREELLIRLAEVIGRQQEELAERAASRLIASETPKHLVGWTGTPHQRRATRPPSSARPSRPHGATDQWAVAQPKNSPPMMVPYDSQGHTPAEHSRWSATVYGA